MEHRMQDAKNSNQGRIPSYFFKSKIYLLELSSNAMKHVIIEEMLMAALRTKQQDLKSQNLKYCIANIDPERGTNDRRYLSDHIWIWKIAMGNCHAIMFFWLPQTQ